MTFDYEIYPEQRMIVARYAGRFSLADLVAATERMWDDPRYSMSFDGIVDISDGSVGVAMADFRAMLDIVRRSGKTSRGRWAAVAGTPLATACGILYQRALAHRHAFEVFSTVDGACSYLGINWNGKGAPRRGHGGGRA
ncbi:MAG: hypothetical protein V4773_00470 [Verrucomicrobiota bacterium]